jgi:(2Fe-2S) ferredoxin
MLSSDAEGWARDTCDPNRLRIFRGGCYGLCDLGVNVVVRRWPANKKQADEQDDRLTLTYADNETVYSMVQPDELIQIFKSHLEADKPIPDLTSEVREAKTVPESPTLARIRKLRQERKKTLVPAEKDS